MEGTAEARSPTNVTMERSSFASESLSGPAEIIASLPGVLGFYPHESVIVLGLVDNDRPGCATLGPVLRSDITHAHELGDIIGELPMDRCVAFLAVLVTRIPHSPLAEAAINALFALTTDTGAPLIDACWHVSEIATGTPYSLVFEPGKGSVVAGSFGKEWTCGTVSSVAASPAMKPLITNGVLPELSREDTYSHFEWCPPGDHEEAEEREARQKLAARRGSELTRKINRGDPRARAGALEAGRSLSAFPARQLIGVDADDRSDQLDVSDDDLVALATLLSSSILRDGLINMALADPACAGTAMMSVARTFTGVIRANALCVWAILAIDKGLTSWATAALMTALEEVPSHNLSGLIIDLMRIGQEKSLIHAARDGSVCAW
ncbi:DUF4192 domain-containing protein [Corynebacterium timonense]|uniref:DUF4192 domain-containing protein n=1 Tax=Corynebacterium timonense TaxID=441500 RepID=A0A1H1NDU5_9CORY|nr:DUF4192 domain-containing protein [Corynebacterium timonense]SDR97171.1 protein of unknown function [Corynebacterium timonense]